MVDLSLMKYRPNRIVLGLIAALTLCISGLATPAFAGTLTSASFTAQAAYTYTHAQNTHYNWAFTTATTATLSKVTATVPAGTDGTNRYLALNGNDGNYASTPDSSANSITGDIDIRAHAALPAWTPATMQILVSKRSGSGINSYQLRVDPTGQLLFTLSADGSSTQFVYSTAPGIADGANTWVRVTAQMNDGAGHSVYTFYKSTDGSSWTTISSSTAAPTSIFDSTTPLTIGNWPVGGGATTGKIYYAEVRNGIGGAVVNKFDPSDATAAQATTGSWASSSTSAETWTVNRSGSNLPADIATDLTVDSVTGIPTGGAAAYRFIDGVASYIFSTATSVSSSTPCTLVLSGFINTATAGNYSSLIKTWSNAGTPATVDSVTTSTLTFTDISSSQLITARVDPSFMFGVANKSSACNGEPNFASAAGTANTVTFGHLGTSSNVSGGQTLTITSNSSDGFAIYVRGVQGSQNLRSGSHNWSDVAGTYASPAALGSGERFGYTYKDSTTSSSVTNPGNALYVAVDTTNRAVSGSASSSTGSTCIGFTAQSSTTTPPDVYSATVIYTAVPVF